VTPTGSLRAISLMALAIAAPWLSLAPTSSGVVAVVLGALTLLSAFHGFGLLVAYLVGRGEASPLVIVHWGIAAIVLVAGVGMALHAYGLAMQSILVYSGAALHSGFLIHQFPRSCDRLATTLRERDARYWAPAVVLLVVVGLVHLVGSAGDLGGRPFDDDGHHLAQLRRLLDTGTLGDAIGFTRSSQLGGQLALGSLVNVVGSPELLRLVDGGLGFILVLSLAVSRIRPHDAASGLWSVLVVLVAASFPSIAPDPSMRWLAMSLMLALYVDLGAEQRGSLVPTALLAGTLATLRFELVPISVLGLYGTWAASRRDRRSLAGLTAVALAVVIPYLVVAVGARGSVSSALELGAPDRRLMLPVVVFAVLTVVAAAGSRLIGDRSRRWIAWTTLVGVAGIVGHLTGARTSPFLGPIAVAGGLAFVIDALRTGVPSARPRPAALVLALLACLLIYEGRDTSGRVRWSRRYLDLLSNLELVRSRHPVPTPASPYQALLDQIPAGQRVAVWVIRPELLDYTRHEIFDLRTPRVTRLRATTTTGKSKLGELLHRLGVRYVLIESDHRPLERAQRDLVYRFACGVGHQPALCADDLEATGLGEGLIASSQNVRLVALTAKP